MMRIQRYFGLLLVASTMCFVYLALNSRLVQTEFFSYPSKVLDRYGRQVSQALSFSDQWNRSEDDNAIVHDEPSTDVSFDQQTYFTIQNLIYKLYNFNNSTREGEGDSLGTSGDNNSENKNDRCQETQESIVFLKTHKTASSTLTNIFNRFADLRDLKVALPLPGFNRFMWPRYFSWTSVDVYRLNGEYANILCNHARYYRPSMEPIMELGTKYVTILREPVSQFESTFDYMEMSTYLGLQNEPNSMEIFLRSPYEFLVNVSRRAIGGFPDSLNLARNGMFFDLGLSPRFYDNKTEIKYAIRKIDQEFSVVMIMEYFDESLVLLKRELCWELEDIVYAKFNQRHGERRKKQKISSKLRRMIKKWNSADVMLYTYFNRTFWRKIKSHGEDFYKDLKEFRRKNAELQRECISPVDVRERAVGLTKHVKGLLLNPLVSRFNRYFCQKILTNEVDYIKYFRMKMHPHLGYQRQLKQESFARDVAQHQTKFTGAEGRRNQIGNTVNGRYRNDIPVRPVLPQNERWREAGVQFVDIPPAQGGYSPLAEKRNKHVGSRYRKQRPGVRRKAYTS